VKKLLLRLLLSLAIGALMLCLAARKIDFGNVGSAMASAHYWVVLPYMAVMAAQHFFRAWRWQYLLAPVDHVPFGKILLVASVGFFAIIALPFRMGELIRPYLIADPPRLRMSHALGTLAVERVFDGLFLALTCFIVLTAARSTTQVPAWLLGAGMVALAVFLAALVVLVLALWHRDRAVTLCRRLFGLLSSELGERLAHIAEGVVDGFRALPDWRRMLPFVGASLAYWLLNGVAVWLMARGFDLGLGLGQSIAVLVIVGVGIMIPAGPAFIGNFEAFAAGAVSLYAASSVVAQRGAAFILALHAANALWYAATGILALLSHPHRVTLAQVWRASTRGMNGEEAPPSPGNKLDKPPEPADAAPEAPADD
jgi:hypothetical protein